MAYLTSDELLAILDSYALTYLILDEVYGDGTGSNTASKAVKTNLERILNLTQAVSGYNNISKLADYTYDIYETVLSSNINRNFRMALDQIWRLMDNDLENYLINNGLRIHKTVGDMFSTIGKTLSAKCIMAPPISNMGTFEIKTTEDEFIDGDSVDTETYGNTKIKIKTLVQIGSSNPLFLNVTLKDFDDNETTKEITIPALTPVNSEFEIDGYYVDVTNVTKTSGNIGDKIQLFSVWERELKE